MTATTSQPRAATRQTATGFSLACLCLPSRRTHVRPHLRHQICHLFPSSSFDVPLPPYRPPGRHHLASTPNTRRRSLSASCVRFASDHTTCTALHCTALHCITSTAAYPVRRLRKPGSTLRGRAQDDFSLLHPVPHAAISTHARTHTHTLCTSSPSCTRRVIQPASDAQHCGRRTSGLATGVP